MPIVQVTPEEAKRLLDSGGFIYLDVRTVPEFVNGHAPSSLNIPVVEMNQQIVAMELNEKFLGVVAANIPPDALLIVGCKTGGRSTTACKLLAQAGYKNLRNLDGGYAGVTDPTGQIVKEGWSTLGYPIERGDGGAKSYVSLSKTAKR
jgi:rhodanese-related sulfurtransferase